MHPIMFNSVVFPDPDGPAMEMNSPFSDECTPQPLDCADEQ
jgi:hypothetical protein